MKDFLFFDKMLTPKIIIFVYWLLLLVAVVGGLSSMFGGHGGHSNGRFFMGILNVFVVRREVAYFDG
jgi:hypothetical protein